MDDGAFYQVHSASGVLEGFDADAGKLNEDVQQVIGNPEKGLLHFAAKEQDSARYSRYAFSAAATAEPVLRRRRRPCSVSGVATSS
jgi:hypothetical protein